MAKAAAEGTPRPSFMLKSGRSGSSLWLWVLYMIRGTSLVTHCRNAPWKYSIWKYVLLWFFFWSIQPCSTLRNYSCQCSGNHMGCLGLNLCWLHVTQMPYLLYSPGSNIYLLFGDSMTSFIGIILHHTNWHRKEQENQFWWACREKRTLILYWWECCLVQPFWKTIWVFHKKKKTNWKLIFQVIQQIHS